MTRLAAVDIGTNSVRLLVADVEGAGRDATLVPVERRMRITRLGQGVDKARVLAPEAIDRSIAVLREYRQVIDELGATKVRATATSARATRATARRSSGRRPRRSESSPSCCRVPTKHGCRSSVPPPG